MQFRMLIAAALATVALAAPFAPQAREPALNAGGYRQIINNGDEKRALNAGGYRQIINNDDAEEKRALNAGYRESVNNAETEKRALNAGSYNQVICNREAGGDLVAPGC